MHSLATVHVCMYERCFYKSTTTSLRTHTWLPLVAHLRARGAHVALPSFFLVRQSFASSRANVIIMVICH
jgi:hypothetical protein